MNREEQIKEEALKECSSFDIPDKEVRFKGVNSAYGLGFCEGAMWADKNPKETVDWQQVRIQAAIAAMQGMLSNDCALQSAMDISEKVHRLPGNVLATMAISQADALIEELKGE